MSKFSNRLLILALLSAFATTTCSSAVAAEKDRDKRGKNKPGVAEKEHRQSGEDRRAKEEHHGKDRSERDNDGSMTAKTSVVTVTNRGGGPLTITAAPSINRLTGTGTFAIVAPGTGTPCAASLVVASGGGKCTIGVQYTPSDKGVSTARLTLTDTGAETTTQETVIRTD
ncbi:MAG TPA: hypothetical protein VMV48_07375 [Gallionellaceae bacterium]|nr:hypothetical protein [Gallionellaceae bacterium]